MSNWPEGALGPGDYEQPIPKQQAKFEAVSPSMESAESPADTADSEFRSMRIGLIGRAAMNKRVPIGVVLELLDNKQHPGLAKGPYSRGHGL